MSQINKEDILHIAELAKIHIDENECETLGKKLSNILDLVEQMQASETDDIEPMTHAIYQNQKLRADKAEDDKRRDDYQRLSRETENGFYLVPKVIE